MYTLATTQEMLESPMTETQCREIARAIDGPAALLYVEDVMVNGTCYKISTNSWLLVDITKANICDNPPAMCYVKGALVVYDLDLGYGLEDPENYEIKTYKIGENGIDDYTQCCEECDQLQPPPSPPQGPSPPLSPPLPPGNPPRPGNPLSVLAADELRVASASLLSPPSPPQRCQGIVFWNSQYGPVVSANDPPPDRCTLKSTGHVVRQQCDATREHCLHSAQRDLTNGRFMGSFLFVKATLGHVQQLQ